MGFSFFKQRYPISKTKEAVNGWKTSNLLSMSSRDGLYCPTPMLKFLRRVLTRDFTEEGINSIRKESFMHEIKKILVVSASTSTCKRAIHDGVNLAKQLGAKLYVYHSDYDPFNLEGWNLPIPSLRVIQENYREQMEADRTLLNEIIEQEKTPDMQVKVFVTEKPLVKEVSRIVHEEKIDLLIMTAFEEGRLEHYIFGHSTHEIVRTMPCSIMLVKEHHSWEE